MFFSRAKCKSGVLAFLFEPQKLDKRYHNIDFLRIVFCFSVLNCHSIYLLNFGEDINKHIGSAVIVVNNFFILSGFLMYNSIKKGKFTSGKDFVIAKIARLWPVFAFSQIFFVLFYFLGIINQKPIFGTEFLNLFFLREIGFNTFGLVPPRSSLNGGWHTNTHAWYLGPLFWGMLFYFIVLKVLKKRQSSAENVALSMIFFVLFFNAVYCHIPWLINLGRGFGFLALGIFFGVIVESKKEKLGSYVADTSEGIVSKKTFLMKKLIFSAIEIAILHRIYMVLFKRGAAMVADYNLAYGILFCILMFSFMFDFGYIGKLLNRKIFSLVGSWGYSVYIMQWIVQQTLSPFNNNKLYAKCEFYRAFKDGHPVAMFWIYILICFVVGALAYYFVEKPCYKKIMDKFGAKKEIR